MTLTIEELKYGAEVGDLGIDAVRAVCAEALANREAQPVAATPIYQFWDDDGWCDTSEQIWRETYDDFRKEQYRIVYTAPPAPAVPPEATPDNIENLLADITLFFTAGNLSHGGSVMFAEVWNSCRAAMLTAAPEGGNGA